MGTIANAKITAKEIENNNSIGIGDASRWETVARCRVVVREARRDKSERSSDDWEAKLDQR